MNLYTSHFKILFLTKISLLVTLIFLFLVTSELLIRNKIVYKDPFNNSVNLYWKSKSNLESKGVIFGSSEIARGLLINSSKIYNLALGGEHLGITKAKVENYIMDKRELGLIILPATATTLNRSYDDVKNDDRIKFFSEKQKPYFYLSMRYHRRYILNYWSKYLIENDLFSTVKLLKYGGQIRTNQDKFIPYFQRNEAEKEKMVKIAYVENYNFVYEQKEKSPGYKIYNDLIQKIIQKNGKVCLVHMPYVQKYNDLIRENLWLYNKMPAIWESLENKYKKNVKFLNLSAYIDEDKYFRDATHLTKEGGEKYGKKILDLCLKELS